MEEIVVYIIVAASATALVLKIRKGIKNKGKCDGCSGCNGCSKANHCNNGQFYCGNSYKRQQIVYLNTCIIWFSFGKHIVL